MTAAQGEPLGSPVKLVVLYGVPTDPEAFEQYYRETHIPIAQKMPGVDRVELGRVLGTPEGDPPFYRIAEVWFKDMDQLQASMGSAEGQAVVADLPNFATGGVTVLIAEAGSS